MAVVNKAREMDWSDAETIERLNQLGIPNLQIRPPADPEEWEEQQALEKREKRLKKQIAAIEQAQKASKDNASGIYKDRQNGGFFQIMVNPSGHVVRISNNGESNVIYDFSRRESGSENKPAVETYDRPFEYGEHPRGERKLKEEPRPPSPPPPPPKRDDELKPEEVDTVDKERLEKNKGVIDGRQNQPHRDDDGWEDVVFDEPPPVERREEEEPRPVQRPNPELHPEVIPVDEEDAEHKRERLRIKDRDNERALEQKQFFKELKHRHPASLDNQEKGLLEDYNLRKRELNAHDWLNDEEVRDYLKTHKSYLESTHQQTVTHDDERYHPAQLSPKSDEQRAFERLLLDGVPPQDLTKFYRKIHGSEMPENLWNQLSYSWLSREYLPRNGHLYKGKSRWGPNIFDTSSDNLANAAHYEITPLGVAMRALGRDNKLHWKVVPREELNAASLSLKDDDEAFERILKIQRDMRDRIDREIKIPKWEGGANDVFLKQARRILRTQDPNDQRVIDELHKIEVEREKRKKKLPTALQETKDGWASRVFDLVTGGAKMNPFIDDTIPARAMGLKKFRAGEHVIRIDKDEDGKGAIVTGQWGSSQWVPLEDYRYAKNAGRAISGAYDKAQDFLEDIPSYQLDLWARFADNAINKGYGAIDGAKQTLAETVADHTKLQRMKMKAMKYDARLNAEESRNAVKEAKNEGNSKGAWGNDITTWATTAAGVMTAAGHPLAGAAILASGLGVRAAFTYVPALRNWIEDPRRKAPPSIDGATVTNKPERPPEGSSELAFQEYYRKEEEYQKGISVALQVINAWKQDNKDKKKVK
jgi:hypothetical protein